MFKPDRGSLLNHFNIGHHKSRKMTAEIILVRSAKMHEMEFDPELLAGKSRAGVNNIPLDRCSEQDRGFNTPGAKQRCKRTFIFAAIVKYPRYCRRHHLTKEKAEDPISQLL